MRLVDINSKAFKAKVVEILSQMVEKDEPMSCDQEHPRRFVKLPDGWIKDLQFGIEWGPSSAKSMNLKLAEEYCRNVGGRLPTLEELKSLVRYDRHEPAIDTAYFTDAKHDYYWTSTKTAWRNDASWCVSFSSGGVNSYYEGSVNYVRPVRASQ